MGCTQSKDDNIGDVPAGRSRGKSSRETEKIMVHHPLGESPGPNPFEVPNINTHSDEFGPKSAGTSTAGETMRTKMSPSTTACTSPVSAKRQEGTTQIDRDDHDTVCNRSENEPPRTTKQLEHHVNSLDRYQSTSKPPTATPFTSVVPSSTVANGGQPPREARPHPATWQRRSRSHRTTPFEAPQNFLLLAEDALVHQHAEELWQQQIHSTLQSLEWSSTTHISRQTQ